MARKSKLAPEDVLITHELYRRQPSSADLECELAAYRELSALMAADPSLAIRRFLDLALELCPAAGSAGLSELEGEGSDGVFTWTAMSGALASYVGGTTPRDFSPCGLCLDHHHTILLDRPGRVFSYLNAAKPEIVEGLIVPLYDTGKRPIGTLWITSHEQGLHFDPTQARVLEQLAVQLVLAIKLRRKAALHLQLEQAVRDKEMLVDEVRHRVKNMIQMTSSLLMLQEKGVNSGEARSALREAQSRLLVLASVYESLLVPRADTRRVDIADLIKRLATALASDGSAGATVQIVTECEQLLIGVVQAVPVGLVVNEVVTNSLKHAFKGRRSGRICIRLTRSGSTCTLTISDDGVGFEAPMREGSLGMRLLASLARQIRGKLSIDGSAGATVELVWESSEDGELPMERSAAQLSVS